LDPPIERPKKHFAAFVMDKEFFENVQVWKHPANEFCDCQTSFGHQKVKMTV